MMERKGEWENGRKGEEERLILLVHLASSLLVIFFNK
jgi:hypothetical protein